MPWLKNQFKSSIVSIHIDEGGEFKGQNLQNFFADLGIETFHGVPHMH